MCGTYVAENTYVDVDHIWQSSNRGDLLQNILTLGVELYPKNFIY